MRITLFMMVGLCTVFAAALAGADVVTFEDDVLPVFRDHCLSCHNTEKKRADIDLSVYSAILDADIVAAGDLDDSILYQVITHAEKPTMPPDQPKIAESQLAIVRAWIEGGLVERSGAKAIHKKKSSVAGLSDVPSGRPDGPPCMPIDSLLEPTVALERPGTVTAMACAPWAPLLAVGARQQVLVYHTAGLDLIAVLPFPEGTPQVLRFSRSGTLLLAGGGRAGHSGRVVVWDVETSRRVCEVGDELDAVMAADISPDQTEIALGGASKLVHIYSTATGERVDTIRKHAEWITGIQYSPDGVLLATADRGGGLFVWESFSRQLFHDLRGHDTGIAEVCWRADSDVVATAGSGGQALLWNMNNGAVIKKWKAHEPGMTSIAFAADGRLVTAGRDQVVKTWQASGKGIRAFLGLTDIATRARFDESGTRVIGSDWAGQVVVWSEKDAVAVGKIVPAPPTIAARSMAVAKELSVASKEFKSRDSKRAEAERLDVGRAAELAKFTKVRDGALADHEGARLRLEKSEALLAAIQSAITAAVAVAEQGADVSGLLETQRGLSVPAAALRDVTSAEETAAKTALAAAEAPLVELGRSRSESELAAKKAAAAAELARRSVADCKRRLSRWEAAAINVARLRARDEVESAEAGLALLQEEHDAKQLLVDARQRELSDATRWASDLPGDRAQHEARIAMATATCTAANQELGALRDQLDKRVALYDAAKALLASVTQRAEADAENEALRDAVMHAQSTVEALGRDRDAAQGVLDAHRVQVSADESVQLAAVAALAKLDATAAAWPAEIERRELALESSVVDLRKKAGDLEAGRVGVQRLRARFAQVDARFREAQDRAVPPGVKQSRDAKAKSE